VGPSRGGEVIRKEKRREEKRREQNRTEQNRREEKRREEKRREEIKNENGTLNMVKIPGSLTLRNMTVCSSETSVKFYRTIWHYLPKHGTLEDSSD
jgi:hypothetical protein